MSNIIFLWFNKYINFFLAKNDLYLNKFCAVRHRRSVEIIPVADSTVPYGTRQSYIFSTDLFSLREKYSDTRFI